MKPTEQPSKTKKNALNVGDVEGKKP